MELVYWWKYYLRFSKETLVHFPNCWYAIALSRTTRIQNILEIIPKVRLTKAILIPKKKHHLENTHTHTNSNTKENNGMEKRMWRKWISLLMCSFLLAFIQFEIKKWSANEKAHLLSWHHNKSSHSIFQVDGNVCIKYIYVLCSVWSFLGLSNLRNVNVCLCQMQSDIKLATLPNKKMYTHSHSHLAMCLIYVVVCVMDTFIICICDSINYYSFAIFTIQWNAVDVRGTVYIFQSFELSLWARFPQYIEKHRKYIIRTKSEKGKKASRNKSSCQQ